MLLKSEKIMSRSAKNWN